MTPMMLRCVLEAVAGGLLPAAEFCQTVKAVGRGQAVSVALRRLYPDAPEAGVADEPGLTPDVMDDDFARAVDPDELTHLFEALRVCRAERGPCLLLSAAIVSDWGVDPELLVGVDAEDEVDELLAAGGVAEAVELARAGTEHLGIH